MEEKAKKMGEAGRCCLERGACKHAQSYQDNNSLFPAPLPNIEKARDQTRIETEVPAACSDEEGNRLSGSNGPVTAKSVFPLSGMREAENTLAL